MINGLRWLKILESLLRQALKLSSGLSQVRLTVYLLTPLALATLSSYNVTNLRQTVGAIAKEHSAFIGITYLTWVDDNKTEAGGTRLLSTTNSCRQSLEYV